MTKTVYLLNGIDVTWYIMRDMNPPFYSPRFFEIKAVEVKVWYSEK